VGVRHALFPGHWHLALVSLRGSPAASFPTLISVASGVFSLLAGLSGRFPVTAYWVRLLRLAGSRSLSRSRPTTWSPACKVLQVSTLNPGSATSGGGALAPGYGSYLLPLRLHFLYSQAIRFSVRPKQEVLSDFASRTHSPSQPALCVSRVRIETFRRG